MNLRRLFTRHPLSVGETYAEHLRSAWSFSASMLLGSLACFVHGVLPFLFERTGSFLIDQLHHRMIANRAEKSPIASIRGGLDR